MYSSRPPHAALSSAAGLIGAAGVLLTMVLAFRLSQPAPQATAVPPPGRTKPCALRPDGYLRGRFFGAINMTADWSGNRLFCDGMQKPDARGVRLFFAGAQQGGGQVSVVIALDGRPDNLIGGERPANVTVIDEQTGRFFSSGGAGRCWSVISSVTPLAWSRDRPTAYGVDGLLFCLGSLPSLSDRTSLTLGDLSFAGQVSVDED